MAITDLGFAKDNIIKSILTKIGERPSLYDQAIKREMEVASTGTTVSGNELYGIGTYRGSSGPATDGSPIAPFRMKRFPEDPHQPKLRTGGGLAAKFLLPDTLDTSASIVGLAGRDIYRSLSEKVAPECARCDYKRVNAGVEHLDYRDRKYLHVSLRCDNRNGFCPEEVQASQKGEKYVDSVTQHINEMLEKRMAKAVTEAMTGQILEPTKGKTNAKVELTKEEERELEKIANPEFGAW